MEIHDRDPVRDVVRAGVALGLTMTKRSYLIRIFQKGKIEEVTCTTPADMANIMNILIRGKSDFEAFILWCGEITRRIRWIKDERKQIHLTSEPYREFDHTLL